MPHIQILGQSLERCFPLPTKNEHQPCPVHERNVLVLSTWGLTHFRNKCDLFSTEVAQRGRNVATAW